MSGPSTPSATFLPTLLTRAFVWVAVPTLLFVHLFVTFRGLSNPTGMEHAQLARELARGNGFHTKMVRPYAWRQLIDHGKENPPMEMTDTINAPLQPLLLAPVFRMFESSWLYEAAEAGAPRPSVYFMDRVVAAVALIFFFASAFMAWLTARALFDETIAGWTFVSLMVCQLLWDVARSGLPQMVVLFFFSVALHQLASGLERTSRGAGTTVQSLVIGMMCALMVMAHWMALAVVAGMIVSVAWQFRPRAVSASLVTAPVVLVLVAWAMRNHAVCGDAFGSAKSVLESALALNTDSWLQRDFSGIIPPTAPDFVTKKVIANVASQIHELWGYLGASLPAALFFLALLHPFRSGVVRIFSTCLAMMWLFALLAMAFTGLPLKTEDANQLHTIFIPAMASFGFAFLAVLWGRLGHGGPHRGWWSRHGAAAGACIISVLPMFTTLPTELTIGLATKGQFAHWPPYLPERTADVREYAKDNEYVMSDAPWTVAWYADTTSVWLPLKRKQFHEMSEAAKESGAEVAGILMTPESLRSERAADVFAENSEYHDWTPLVFRGVMAGFGVDVAGIDSLMKESIPCREFHPLHGQPGNGRLIVEIAFMSDSRPWEHKKGSTEEKKATAASTPEKTEGGQK